MFIRDSYLALSRGQPRPTSEFPAGRAAVSKPLESKPPETPQVRSMVTVGGLSGRMNALFGPGGVLEQISVPDVAAQEASSEVLGAPDQARVLFSDLQLVTYLVRQFTNRFVAEEARQPNEKADGFRVPPRLSNPQFDIRS